jgi:hypothetical protein
MLSTGPNVIANSGSGKSLLTKQRNMKQIIL